MTIGIVVSTEKEREALTRVFGKPVMYNLGTKAYDVTQWKQEAQCIQENKFIYLVVSGPGEIAAASATQYLIDTFAVDKVINYGMVNSGIIITCNRNDVPCVLMREAPED